MEYLVGFVAAAGVVGVSPGEVSLYIVKLRYVVTASSFFCKRLHFYDSKAGFKRFETVCKKDDGSCVVFIFIVSGMVLSFISLIPMLMTEGFDFFKPYRRDVLDKIAQSTERR